MGDEEQAQAIQFKMVDDQMNEVSHWRSYTGIGTANYTNGDKYEGDFLKGRRHGQGVLTYANGDKYEGEWDTNLKSGIGKASFFKKGAEGALVPIGTYHGTFVKGKRSGQGLFMYPNKDRYSGEWKNGLKHGKGTYIFQEPFLKMAGNWFEGKLLTGQWIANSGSVYTGEFENNKPNGCGEWNLVNGNKVTGEYKQEIQERIATEDPENPVDPFTGMRLKLTWKTNNISKA